MSQADCLEYLQGKSWKNVQEVADDIDMSDKCARAKLKSLAKSGLVEVDREVSPMEFQTTEKGDEKDADSLRGMVV